MTRQTTPFELTVEDNRANHSLNVIVLQKRIAELEKLVRAAFIEGFDSGRKNERKCEGYWLLEYWEKSNTRAALAGGKE